MRTSTLVVAALLAGCPGSSTRPSAPAEPQTAVPLTVRLPSDPARAVEVVYESLPVRGGALRLRAAREAVGAYAPSPFADFVTDLEARAPDGRALEVRRLDDRTFEATVEGARSIRLSYRVDAARGERELEDFMVSTHLRPGHALLSGYATFLVAEGCEALPHLVTLETPPGWRVAWALPRDERGRYLAASAFELLDEPAMAGDRFVSAAIPEGSDGPLAWVHVWSAVEDDPPQLSALVAATRDALEGIRALELPPLGRPYHVFFELLPEGADRELGWALEHGASMQGADIASEHREASPRLAYHVTHHMLHAWLPRRLYTDRLAPVRQLEGETTACLWLAEGLPQYLAFVALGRAPAAPTDVVLAMMGRRFVAPYVAAGERAARPMAELSLELSTGHHDDWVLGFAEGGLLSLWLEERLLAEGGPDLAAAVARLAAAAPPEGIPEAELEAALEAATGLDLDEVFSRHVQGAEPLPLDAILAAAGLGLVDGVASPLPEEERTEAARRLADVVLGPIRLVPGDRVTYRYTGTFTPAPVLLTERVLSREGDRLEIEVTAERGGERRRWVQVVTDTLANRQGNVVDELYLVEDEGSRRRLPNEEDRDLYDLYSWTLPPLDGPPTSRRNEEMVAEVSGAARRCARATLEVTSGGRPARMVDVECPRFPWRQGPTSLVAVDGGEVLWQVDLVEPAAD